eukprot:3020498-Rhodomonas_salina.2
MERCIRRLGVCPPIRLRLPYAMSGTGIAYRAIRLRSPCAIPGTVVAYSAIGLRACVAMSY